jgi:hypothetical protein
VVSASTRAPSRTSFDVVLTAPGLELGKPLTHAASATGLPRAHFPVRCMQAVPFNGTVSGKLDGYLKKDVVTMNDTDVFSRSVKLDKSTSTATWKVEFDRETYALFTDVVLRIEDVETGKTLRNSALGQRDTQISITVPKDQSTPKEYRLVMIPAFTLEADMKEWSFMLTEHLAWSAGPIALEPVNPSKGSLNLMPWDWANVEFAVSKPAPGAPADYTVSGLLEAKESGGGTINRVRFDWK